MRRFGIGAAAAFTLAGLGIVSAAKPPKPPTTLAATITFRCYGEQDCLPPANGVDNSQDRVRDDSVSEVAGAIVLSVGMLQVRLSPTFPVSPVPYLSLLLGASTIPRGCESIGNCNPDGDGRLGGEFNTSDSETLELDDIEIRVKAVVPETFADLPGGLTAMPCGVQQPGLAHFTFFFPSGDGHWGLNFNKRDYPASDPVTITRVGNVWTVETPSGGGTAPNKAELLSWSHSGIRGKNGPSREGVFHMPLKFTFSVLNAPRPPSCYPTE